MMPAQPSTRYKPSSNTLPAQAATLVRGRSGASGVAGRLLCESTAFLALCGLAILVIVMWQAMNPIEAFINVVFQQDIPPGLPEALRLAAYTQPRPVYYPL
jgi:hypothetical protein